MNTNIIMPPRAYSQLKAGLWNVNTLFVFFFKDFSELWRGYIYSLDKDLNSVIAHQVRLPVAAELPF